MMDKQGQARFFEMLVETISLTKDFGGLRAVDNVNLNIEKGEFLAIIGPNGAGKTTFFNLLAGKYPPTSGKIIFEGKDITKLPPNGRYMIGIVKTFQIPSIFRKLTVHENMRVAAQSPRISGPRYLLSTMSRDDECNEQVDKLLQRVGLHEFRYAEADGLPHGHKKRLEIGMAIAGREPKLLLLDEVTAGLTAEETKEICNFILDLATHYSVIMVEHKLDVVLGISKRICVMHQGKIIADGAPDEITADEQVQKVYLRGR